jgi:hypothetical protein
MLYGIPLRPGSTCLRVVEVRHLQGLLTIEHGAALGLALPSLWAPSWTEAGPEGRVEPGLPARIRCLHNAFGR